MMGKARGEEEVDEEQDEDFYTMGHTYTYPFQLDKIIAVKVYSLQFQPLDGDRVTLVVAEVGGGGAAIGSVQATAITN